MVCAGCGDSETVENVEAEFTADDRGIVVFAVQIKFIHTVKFPSLDECVKRYFERFLLRIAGSIASDAEADRVHRLIDMVISEAEYGIVFRVALDVIVNPDECVWVNCHVNSCDVGIIEYFPALIILRKE